MAVKQEILLASPVSVVSRLCSLAVQAGFWQSIFFSLSRIAIGFFIAVAAAVVFGILAAKWKLIRQLLSPLVTVVKITPVASFIIVALIWVPSKNLSAFISFLMVFPIIYTNILEGISATDKKLLELAAIYRVSYWKQIKYIYFSQVMPFFRSACAVALGLCWKAGVAAEVIGIPRGSIGEKLYNAKIYLQTPDLFAWTVVIIAVSVLFEKLIMGLIRYLIRKSERV